MEAWVRGLEGVLGQRKIAPHPTFETLSPLWVSLQAFHVSLRCECPGSIPVGLVGTCNLETFIPIIIVENEYVII